MDSMITAAARSLAMGDPLGALKRVALRDDAPALALRGIAMAQLGELVRAKALLRSAARAFGPKEAMARAKCLVAEAEVALASRDLEWSERALHSARQTLEEHGDTINAAHARYLEIRRLVLIGRIEEAERALAAIDSLHLPFALQAAHELLVAGIAMRRIHAIAARSALDRAHVAARVAQIPALLAEVQSAKRALEAPAARAIEGDSERLVALGEVEALLASDAFVVDACRYSVRHADEVVSLARRPVLFTLVRMLSEAWPRDVSREALVARTFRAKRADESYRARLRVEMGRLRRILKPVAGITATDRGFSLVPRGAKKVVVMARPVDDEHGVVLALLADGEAWSTSALAIALDTSQRTVQRALDALAASGKVQAIGRARSRRWMTPPIAGYTTTLLLPAALSVG